MNWTTIFTPSFGAVTQSFCPEVETTERLKAKCQCLKVFSPGLLISSEKNPSIFFLGYIPLVPVFWGHGGRRWMRVPCFRMQASRGLHAVSKNVSRNQTLPCVCRGCLEPFRQFAYYMYFQQCRPSSAFPHIPTFIVHKFSKF